METNVIPTLQRQLSSVSAKHSVSSSGTLGRCPPVEEGEQVTVEGVPHSETTLETGRSRTPQFATTVLTLLRDELHVKSWDIPSLQLDDVNIYEVAGSFTNTVYFVDAPTSEPKPRKVLLRIYGPTSSAFISRPKELYTLSKLSSIYGIGPPIFGTFGNGRVEEYFDSHALTGSEMRDPEISRWIARRMSEVHRADIGKVMMPGGGWEDKRAIAVFRNFQAWLPLAKEVVDALEKRKLPKDHPWHGVVQALDLDRLQEEWKAYSSWLENYEIEHGASERVFAHNDMSSGNLLRLANKPIDAPSHHEIMVVDFEFAAPNPAAFDIAYHFHEWMASYLSETTPWILDLGQYPTLKERQNFYRAYVSPVLTAPSSSNLLPSPSQSPLPSTTLTPAESNAAFQDELDRLDSLVKAWSPSCHAMWTVWCPVRARDDVTISGEVGEFDYLGCAVDRVAAFRREIAELGVTV